LFFNFIGAPCIVRTDAGTDSGAHPVYSVHCRSTHCQSSLVDWHWSNSTGNKCQQHISLVLAHHCQSEWLLYMPNLILPRCSSAVVTLMQDWIIN